MNESNVDKFYNAFKNKSYATVNIYSHYMYNADIEAERMLLEPIGGGVEHYTKSIEALSAFIEKTKKECEKISNSLCEKNILSILMTFPNFNGEVAFFNVEGVEIDDEDDNRLKKSYRPNPFNIILDSYFKNPKPVYTYKLTFRKACIYELSNDVVIYGDCLFECVMLFANYISLIHDYFENNRIDNNDTNIDDTIDINIDDTIEGILKNGKE